MNVPRCPHCHGVLRDQWSSKVKVMKAYKIMAKYRIPLEEISRALNINLGQVMLMAKEANAINPRQDRGSTY